MIKRPAVILLVIIAIVLTSYVLIKKRGAAEIAITPTVTESMLLRSDEHGNMIHIEMVDNTTRIMIGLKLFSDGKWIITEPTEAPADQGLVTAVETQLFAFRILTYLETAPDFSAIGLSAPLYTITIQFEDGSEQVIQVGDKTPTNSGYYLLLNGKVFVGNTSSIDSVLGLLKNPPYQVTPTPNPPDSSITPSLETPTSTGPTP